MDYNNYIDVQKNALSYEHNKPGWKSGQEKAINDFLIPLLSTDSIILDAACGDGVGLKYLNDRGFNNIFGVDLNEKKIEVAASFVSKEKLFLSDIANLKMFKNNFFDYIWSSHTLEHAYKVEDVLTEFKRVCKVGGELLIIVPYPANNHDVHCSVEALKLNVNDEGRECAKYIEQFGFKTISTSTPNIREPELFLRFSSI